MFLCSAALHKKSFVGGVSGSRFRSPPQSRCGYSTRHRGQSPPPTNFLCKGSVPRSSSRNCCGETAMLRLRHNFQLAGDRGGLSNRGPCRLSCRRTAAPSRHRLRKPFDETAYGYCRQNAIRDTMPKATARQHRYSVASRTVVVLSKSPLGCFESDDGADRRRWARQSKSATVRPRPWASTLNVRPGRNTCPLRVAAQSWYRWPASAGGMSVDHEVHRPPMSQDEHSAEQDSRAGTVRTRSSSAIASAAEAAWIAVLLFRLRVRLGSPRRAGRRGLLEQLVEAVEENSTRT